MRFILETNDIAKNKSLPKMQSKNNFPIKNFDIIFNFFFVRVFRRLDCTNLPRRNSNLVTFFDRKLKQYSKIFSKALTKFIYLFPLKSTVKI